jgi:hypothetical protein
VTTSPERFALTSLTSLCRLYDNEVSSISNSYVIKRTFAAEKPDRGDLNERHS